ncbi:hypothetical protein F0U44_13665 [Nocardioides humilatus]|uniref:Uncharacterized protein n=1 Tax=Nocardioides humilatus TaxID=2607660 RepID=A0A5B1LFL5_9ACTN|nr:hypothetical protein [Nocardioides humilatus]KAA1419472.1 hypothetical protein F0U44_13665 [Nocardioides humilatus]
MNRVTTILLSVLIALVAVNGFLVWRADERARDDADKQSCIQKAEATGIIVLLGGESEGRVDAARTLASQIDAC